MPGTSATPEDDTPPELIEYMKELARLEKAGERTTMVIGPYAAMLLAGVIQGATRDPNLSEPMREVLRGLVRQIEPLFVGTPGEQIIQMGYDPEFDRPVG
jgi:hypothetical protein